MIRFRASPRLLAVLVVSLLFALGVSAAATPTPTRAVKHATGPITAVAMDGPRVVYSTDGNGIYVWNVQTGATVRVAKAHPTDFPLIQEVAIAGQRLAWISRDVVGNSMETNENLYTASLHGTVTRKLAHAYRDWGPAGQDPWTITSWQWNGDWISGLDGSGSLIAVSRWTTTPNPNALTETISNPRLSLVSPSGLLRPIAAGEQSIVSASVDGGRIAVLRSDGSVGFYSPTGVLLKVIRPSPAREIAAGGGTLVVLTKAKSLEVYDSRTGALRHRWPVPTRARVQNAGHLKVYGRIALYSVDPTQYERNLVLLDVRTGQRIVLPRQPRSAWDDACVGRLGLVYADNSYKNYGKFRPSGELVFLSTARVLRSIAHGHLM